MLDKTVRVVGQRLEVLGSRLAEESRCDHDAEAVAAALDQQRARRLDPVLIIGASAITDRRDVIPEAIERIGGRVEHFGMPVDPGNLLLFGRDAEGAFVVGLPGCARSPETSGADLVLRRLLANLPLSGRDIMAMGAGGLLKEIPARPAPRGVADPDSGQSRTGRRPRVAALILAAGASVRAGSINKLLVEIDGVPMVARVADAVLTAPVRPVVAVVGHQAREVRAALDGRALTVVENPDHAAGLSTSLKRGLTSLPAEVEGVVVCLGDMPGVSATDIARLVAAFDPAEGRAICVPTHQGKRGNPVLWARRFFPEMLTLSGDVGARHLIGAYAEHVCEVDMGGDGVVVDIDTVEALDELRRS